MRNKQLWLIEFKQIFRLSLPLATTLIVQMGMDVVDTLMLGRISARALAAGALGSAIYVILFVTCLGFCMVCGPLFARANATKDYKTVAEIFYAGVMVSLVLSLVCWIILYFVTYHLKSLNPDPLVVFDASLFLRTLMWAILPGLLFTTLRELAAAFSQPKVIMFITVLGFPLNALLNYLFIYGHWGFPKLGIAGVGLATTLAEWAMCFAILLVLAIQLPLLREHIFTKFSKPSAHVMREIIKLGWPVGFNLTFEVGLFAITSIIMGQFGVIALAAHQIALQYSAIAFMIPLGISQAAAIRIGHHMGKNHLLRAKRASYISLVFSWSCGLVMASIFLLFPEQLASLYLHKKGAQTTAVISMAIIFLRIAAVYQVFDVLQVIMNGVLRGFKDTLIPMMLGMLSYWLIGLGVGALLAFYYHLAGIGLWWGLAIGIFASGVLLYWRFCVIVKKHLITSSNSRRNV